MAKNKQQAGITEVYPCILWEGKLATLRHPDPHDYRIVAIEENVLVVEVYGEDAMRQPCWCEESEITGFEGRVLSVVLGMGLEVE